jgi:hypothetical protein
MLALAVVDSMAVVLVLLPVLISPKILMLLLSCEGEGKGGD